jgi:RNA methyltransferase, TrmH family
MMKAMDAAPELRLRPVASRQNELVRELRKRFAKGEIAGHVVAIEGVRILEEAIRSGLRFEAVFFSEAGKVHAHRLLPQISQHTDALLLPDEVFASAVTTETPQGVAALVRLKPIRLEDLLEQKGDNSLVVAVAGIQDPGNLGTIIRSAEAFSARGVLLGENTVSAANPKAVRASAGSIFREPIVAVKMAEALDLLKGHGYRVVGSSSHKGKALHEADLTGAVALLIGNEGSGVPAALLSQADDLVTIPHSPRVESLNAGIAASVMLYDAMRQRKKIG